MKLIRFSLSLSNSSGSVTLSPALSETHTHTQNPGASGKARGGERSSTLRERGETFENELKCFICDRNIILTHTSLEFWVYILCLVLGKEEERDS